MNRVSPALAAAVATAVAAAARLAASNFDLTLLAVATLTRLA